MIRSRGPGRPTGGRALAVALAGTLLTTAIAEAQYDNWYRLPTRGTADGTPQWVDTAGIQRVGATRLRVWVSSLSRFGLNTPSRQGVDESYDRTEGLYLVNCETGQSQWTETKYLRGTVVVRRVYNRRPRWGSPTVVSEVACEAAGIKPTGDTS